MKTRRKFCESFFTRTGDFKWAEPGGPRHPGTEEPHLEQCLSQLDSSIETEGGLTADSLVSAKLQAESHFL